MRIGGLLAVGLLAPGIARVAPAAGFAAVQSVGLSVSSPTHLPGPISFGAGASSHLGRSVTTELARLARGNR